MSNAEALLVQDPPQIQGIRHQRWRSRSSSSRPTPAPWHGHHDRARPEFRTWPSSTAKDRNKMSVIKDGLEGQRGHLQEGVPTFERVQRRGGRAGGLHDRPLRGRRLLPRQRRARHRREPEHSPGPASCRWPSPSGHRPAWRQAGASAPNRFYMYGVIARFGHGGGELRTGSDRPDAEIYEEGAGTAPAGRPYTGRPVSQHSTEVQPRRIDAGRHRCRLRRHRHQPVRLQGGVRPRPRAVERGQHPSACCR